MKTLSKMMLRAGFVAMGIAMAGSASAAITYKFDATSSYGSAFGIFELTTPTFLTGINIFSPANLTSCSVTFSVGDPICGNQRFDTTFYSVSPFYETIGFGTSDSSETYYYFDQGSFGTVGTHGSQILGSNQFATLTVTDSNIGAVPEPASWALMIAGFGLVGSAMRRKTARVAYA